MTAARLLVSPARRAWAAGLAGVIAAAIPTRAAPTIFDNYVRFASALLHGRLWIVWPGPYIDAVYFAGHRYIVNDPVPGVLLVPYVAVAGIGANQTLLGVLLAGIASAAAWTIAERLDLPPWRRLILCAFFFAGTDLWWCATFGYVWFLAQTSAVAFSLLALAELARPRPRGWLVALAYGLAIGSRFTLVMAVPVLAYLTCRGSLAAAEPVPGGRRRLLGFASVTAAFAALWVAYNEARWHVPWDSGHTLFFHQDRMAEPAGSPFALAHLPYQLASFFLSPPLLLAHAPWIAPDVTGTALTWTSPALAYAVLARRPQASVRALWLAAALVAGPSLLYYVNGMIQFGMRHALDFETFLFVSMCLAARERLPKWAVYLSLYSIAATAYGIWYWIAVVRAVHGS